MAIWKICRRSREGGQRSCLPLTCLECEVVMGSTLPCLAISLKVNSSDGKKELVTWRLRHHSSTSTCSDQKNPTRCGGVVLTQTYQCGVRFWFVSGFYLFVLGVVWLVLGFFFPTLQKGRDVRAAVRALKVIAQQNASGGPTCCLGGCCIVVSQRTIAGPSKW